MPSDHAVSDIPLVTVSPVTLVVSGVLPLTESGSNTALVEDAFNLGRSRYFYSGRAHPGFGDVALAFSPAIEESHSGSATPFDTGGAYWSKLHPFVDLSDQDRLARGKSLVDDTKCSLARWRQELEGFLNIFFAGDEVGYLDGNPPDTDGDWGPEDLPARKRSNIEDPLVDWRAWTWEVRLHEEHEIERELQHWAATADAVSHLEEKARQSDLPIAATDHLVTLFEVDHTIERDASTAFQRLEEQIKEQL